MEKSDFSPYRFALSLSQEHLELLSEFEEVFAEQLALLEQSIAHHKEPTARDLLEVLAAAPKALASKRATPDTRAVSEWHTELGREVTAQEKQGSRLAAVASRPEIQAMLECTKDSPRDHLVIRVLYSTGIRRAELAEIKMADLYLSQRLIFIRSGKGDKDRYVLIDQKTADLLADYTQGFPPDQEVFDISGRTVTRIVQRVGEEVGISQRFEAMGRNFAAHCLRHTCATHMYEGGADLYAIRTLLGHDGIGTTRTYVHMGVDILRDIYTNSHPINTLENATSPSPQ